MSELPIDDDAAWEQWGSQWQLRDDTIYLNHGSFGPPPEPVRRARRQWIDRLDQQPMDFFLRQWMPALVDARQRLADFVGTKSDNLAFVDNATMAMNTLADSFPLSTGDEVLLTDHEYEAVVKTWARKCKRVGAKEPVIAKIPFPTDSHDAIVEAIFDQVTSATKLIVVSDITSPTAIILPIQQICDRAKESGVPICVDGPHAPAQIPLDIDRLNCDFYTASLHKWLCGSFSSGFLYVHPKHHATIEPQVASFGTLPPTAPTQWNEHFMWQGTRDPSSYLSVPAAIDFMESVGLAAFRARTHYLASYARRRLRESTGLEPVTPDSADWYGSMVLAPLPPGDNMALQIALWEQFGIEVPVIEFADKRWLRVSCHLYNDTKHLDRLVEAYEWLCVQSGSP